MSSPYMTKDRVRDTMLIIGSLAHCLEKFSESEGDDFYDKIEYSVSNAEEIDSDERADMIDNVIRHNVVKLDMFNYEFVPYLRSQPESYIAFLKAELMPAVLPAMKSILEQKDIENKIFRHEESDLMHDVYLVLKGAYLLFTRLDALLSGDENDTDYALDYRLSFLGSYLDDEKDESEAAPMPLPNAFMWFGTPAELACLMDTLHEKGYIETPKRTNGERNNEGFSRMIGSHFRLAKGSEKSVLNNLKDPRITPDNQFKIVMDKLPKKK